MFISLKGGIQLRIDKILSIKPVGNIAVQVNLEHSDPMVISPCNQTEMINYIKSEVEEYYETR